MNGPCAWERQPHETSKAFAAFCAYRDMTPPRIAEKAADLIGGGRRMFRVWCAKHKWVERAARWDDEVDRRKRVTAQEVRDKVVADHARVAEQMRLSLLVPVRSLARRMTARGDALLSDATDAELVTAMQRSAAALRGVVDVERVSHGLPTSHQAVSGPDGGPVQVSTTLTDLVRRMFTRPDPAPDAPGNGANGHAADGNGSNGHG